MPLGRPPCALNITWRGPRSWTRPKWTKVGVLELAFATSNKNLDFLKLSSCVFETPPGLVFSNGYIGFGGSIETVEKLVI